MRLKDPGAVDRAIEIVSARAMTLQNTTVTGRGAEGLRDAWLDWWGQTDAQLRSLFVDSELADELLRTQIEVQRLLEHGRPFIFINSINQLWKSRLDGVVEQLKSLRSFTAHIGCLVVIDTSALIEGEHVATTDWRSVIGCAASDSLRLLVPMLVVEELDALKRDRDPRVMSRARKVLKALSALVQSPNRPATLSAGVTIEVLADEPGHARLPVNDDEIVDRASYIRQLCGREVTVVAGDYSLIFRARALGLTAVMATRVPTDTGSHER
jgi:rRNA maturation endonuclease Nob1